MASFSEREVRYLLDLSRRSASSGSEPVAKQRRLLAGLCRLVNASSGAMALLRDDFSIVGEVLVAGSHSGQEDLLNYSDYSASGGDRQHYVGADNPLLQPAIQEALKHYLSTAPLPEGQAAHQRLRHGSQFFRRFLSRLGMDDCILSVVPLPRLKPFMAALCLSGPGGNSTDTHGRAGHDPVRFTSRQRRLIHVAHGGLRWIYYPEPNLSEQRMSAPLEYDCPMRSPAPELAPRYQRVLNHLLAGGSEKALADQLGLSRHTIHEYVRAIYRIFNVNSRSELMAHYVEA